MIQYGFYLDNSRCTGCKTCELACKDYKDLTKDFSYRKVFDYEAGDWSVNDDGTCETTAYAYHVSMACNHCDIPACVHVCPTGAMHKNPDTSLVSVDTTKCIGCGYCHMACPYSAPKVDRSKGHSVKCNGCEERVVQGLRPICVEACPLRALDFGPVDEMRVKDGVSGKAAIAPLPDPSYTGPNFYIKPSPAAQPVDSVNGKVANLLEVQ